MHAFRHPSQRKRVGDGNLSMLTAQLFPPSAMFSPRKPPAQTDGRSVGAVFDAAAARFGRDRETAAVRELVAGGVEYSQQLAELSDRDWEMVGVSLGLKTAVKVELGDPSVSAPEPFEKHDDDKLDEKLRQFLLLPSADGMKEAKPLDSVSGFFLSLLATPVAERQRLLLMLCELIALVSGLFLQLPLMFRRRELAVYKGWDMPPSLADGMDALALFVFWLDAWVTFAATMMAVMIVACGWNASGHHCYGALSVLATLFLYVFMQFTMWPLLMLAIWHAFTDATSPYPLIGSLVIGSLFYFFLMNMTFNFMLENVPLEVYHMPRWLKVDLKYSMPWLRSQLDDKALKPRAELRAAQLRTQMGYKGHVQASSSTHDA